MPMPHKEMRRLIKRRINGKSETERITILQVFLEDLPRLSGPYAELRRWVRDEIEKTRVRKGVKHQETFAVPKEGAAQVVLVGPPNAGKSSLLKTLTGRQVAIGDYAFTTLKPVAGMLKMEGAVIQVVEIPGLLEGAGDGRGGGPTLLSCIRTADAILYVVPLTPDGLATARAVATEVDRAGIDLPFGVAATKSDLPEAQVVLPELRNAFADHPFVTCSTATGEGLDTVRHLIWRLTGLVRVYPKPRGDRAQQEPVVLPPGSTVEAFVTSLQPLWLERFRQARVSGPSARFPWQPVGLHHPLSDGDIVELVLDIRS